VGLFVKKAYEEANKDKIVVMLINCATDTKWFHEYIYNQQEVRFVKGRITFINPNAPEKKCPSPRPSMIVVFRKID
jgi:Ni,Fe-hydrogenase III small subunit